MELPLVNVINEPYEQWAYRNATIEEMQALSLSRPIVRDKLLATVNNCTDAAVHTATTWRDNALSSHINNALEKSLEYKYWRKCMPTQTPAALSDYQNKYPHYCQTGVNQEINSIGYTLSTGQCLFHGGLWSDISTRSFKTSRPLSASFCPQVALQNAIHGGKAYDANQIHLLVLHAVAPKTKVFVFRRKGTNLGHENEVLFASGADLVLKKCTKVCSNYPVGKCGMPEKLLDIFVMDVEIS